MIELNKCRQIVGQFEFLQKLTEGEKEAKMGMGTKIKHLAIADEVGHMRRQCAGEKAMAKVVTGDALKSAVENETFIKGGNPNCAEGLKYDFRLGTRILKASLAQPVDIAMTGRSRSC